MNIEIEPTIWTHLPEGIPFLGGMPVTNTLVTALISSFILLILAILVRLFVFSKFKEKPRGLQNIIELIVEAMQKYTNSKVGEETGNALGPYIFTLAAFVIVNGLTELVSMGQLRPAPSDINETAAFAFVTFLLIRFFAYRKKGVWGRLKSFLVPTPIIAPIKLVVDIAIPVSLACRMFGNLLGGLVVMELLYGSFPFIAPAFAATFFTLFHTGMQAFIFITLSLAFIEEAIE